MLHKNPLIALVEILDAARVRLLAAHALTEQRAQDALAYHECRANARRYGWARDGAHWARQHLLGALSDLDAVDAIDATTAPEEAERRVNAVQDELGIARQLLTMTPEWVGQTNAWVWHHQDTAAWHHRLDAVPVDCHRCGNRVLPGAADSAEVDRHGVMRFHCTDLCRRSEAADPVVTCARCGREFKASSFYAAYPDATSDGGSYYCSQKCDQLSNHTARCAYCGQPVWDDRFSARTPDGSKVVYCSTDCGAVVAQMDAEEAEMLAKEEREYARDYDERHELDAGELASTERALGDQPFCSGCGASLPAAPVFSLKGVYCGAECADAYASRIDRDDPQHDEVPDLDDTPF